MMLFVSIAAIWHVSALHALGSLTASSVDQSRCGYAMRWCSKIHGGIGVTCARVRLGSACSMSAGWRDTLESCHFCGRNIFQLKRMVGGCRAGLGGDVLYEPQVELFEACQPAADLLAVLEINLLRRK